MMEQDEMQDGTTWDLSGLYRMRSASCVVPYKNRQVCISEGEHVMMNSLFYLSFAFVAASAIGVEFLINKSFRRRAVEIEEEAENLINAGLAKTAESLQELKDRGISWKYQGRDQQCL